VKRVAEAGATYVGACALRLQSAARKRYLPFIEQEFPHLAERYHNTYSRSYQAGDKYRAGLSSFFRTLCRKYGLPDSSRVAGDEDDRENVGDGSEQLALSIYKGRALPDVGSALTRSARARLRLVYCEPPDPVPAPNSAAV
jgi:hypothetical protein